MNEDYNPNSIDAVLARIEANQKDHTETLNEIRDEAKKTNGRVTALEQDKWHTRGVTAAVSVLAVAVWEYWKGGK
jgi:SepF-like predicted cell division protein (DUF552 family)